LKPTVNYSETFELLDIRVGTIVAAEVFTKARNPSYKILIDFGAEIGTKRSSAQITTHYNPDDLNGRKIVAIVNFPPRNIAGFMSEVLILGIYDQDSNVVLLNPDKELPDGSIIG